MGMVYEAEDLERDVRIALKTVLHHDADALARFKREFRALQDINHPNLVGPRGARGGRRRGVLHDGAGGGGRSPHVRAGRVERARGDDVEDRRRGAAGGRADAPRPAGLRVLDRPTEKPRVARAIAIVDPTFDEIRLRDAFRQVAQGLSALHEANKVHRDVKPPNVLVTKEGRVVLLDFGLVAETDERSADLRWRGRPRTCRPSK